MTELKKIDFWFSFHSVKDDTPNEAVISAKAEISSIIAVCKEGDS